MKKDNVNYVLVGGLVLSMFLLLIVVLVRISGRDAGAETYYINLSDVTGILDGSAVTYGGYQIGQVNNIVPRRNSNRMVYQLGLSIKSDWKIPKDSIARIVSPGLLSDNVIDIKEGESSEFMQPGGTIESAEQLGMFAALDTVALEIKQLSEHNIKPLLANLSQKINAIGSDLDLRIPRITKSTDRLLARANESLDQLNSLLGGTNQSHLTSIIKNADVISQNLSELTTGFGKARAQIDTLLSDSRAIISENKDDIRNSVMELRHSLETISQNMHTIMYNLDSSSRNVNEFSRQIRENPGVVLNGKAPADKASMINGVAASQ